MGTYAALAHTTWVGGYDMTTDLNATGLDISFTELDDSRFGMTGRSRKAGLEAVESAVEGAWDAGTGTVDPTVFAAMGSTIQVVTQTVSGTELDVGYIWQARQLRYELFGKLDEIMPFTLGMKGTRGAGASSVGAVRGRLLKAKGNISATGVAGTGYQLGAVTSAQYLYCAVQCFSIGTSFTLQIQSDDNAGFSSATTRMTVGSITATGGYWGTRVAGPFTDDYWRVNVSAVSGTSQIGVLVGIK